MPEAKAEKGIQISKIAKEVNRQSGEILDYLKRIGIEVGGIMSKVDESVHNKILGHFKTDFEEVSKHKQKLMDFKKKHKGIEISEIEEDLKKEKERKIKEEEERQKRVEQEEHLKAERDGQMQKELDEKRRLIKEKEDELEKQKQAEIEAKKKKEKEAKHKTEEEQKQKVKEPEKKKEEPVKAEEPVKKPVKETREVLKDKKPGDDKFKKHDGQKGKDSFESRKPDGKFESRKPDGKFEPRKPGGKFEPRKPGGKFEGKKPGGKFEGKKPGGKFEGKKPGGKFEGKKPGDGKFEGKKPGDGKFESKKPGDGKFEGKRFEGRFDRKKTGGTFERVTIKEDFRKPKRIIPGQKPYFKKPFVSREDERKRELAKDVKPAAESADAIARKRDSDKKDKTKKQKYIDGLEAKKRKKFADEEITQQIEEAIRETMAKMDDAGSPSARAQLRKRKKKERIELEAKQQLEDLARQNVLTVTEFLSAGELAVLMQLEVSQLITKCFELGMMVTINQRLEKDLITLLADEFGFKVEFQKEYEADILTDTQDAPETLVQRPPVVTIMGHVDHGKTSLLDYIRKANVVAGEAGGITQHIGAYQVKIDDGRLITFLDTPGHEAFTAMRARGAQITDIVILVVAADDSVMPQTIEAINHALAANVPIVVAINKIDKPAADPLKIKTQLSEKGILVEEWGGKYQSVEISAKTGLNIEQLLEKILVESELLELKANPNRTARGVIVEAKLDKGKGISATVLVQRGTLKTGDSFIAGIYSGRVKAMFDERGNRVETAKPAAPVQVLGFDGMPQAGDSLIVMEYERDAKVIANKRQLLKREQDFRQIKFTTLDDISKQIKEGKQVDLNVIIKGDVDGSVEALSDSLLKLGTSEVKVSVIHKGIGEISENDVLLATASNAIIVGFNVRPNLKARKLAEAEKVDIRLHNIIYDVINEIKLALEGLLEPEKSEEILATVEVRQTFKVPKAGMVAGCYVLDGKIIRNSKVRLLRDGFVIYDGSINALKRFKDDVREVEQGFECGISLENFNDIKISDIIESYRIVEIKRKLEQ